MGPAVVELRQELSPRSPVTAKAAHGERVEILERRRRFLRVRTGANAAGWLDGRHLLNEKQMAAFLALNQSFGSAASFGKATVYEPLNVHTEPNRGSPSAIQIPEKGSVEVIGHTLAPRVPYAAPLSVEQKSAPRKKAAKKVSKKGLEPPPAPPAPAVPGAWLDLSRTVEDGKDRPTFEIRAAELEASRPKPALEDWSLVRTPEAKVGWVLTGMLVMAIPDEVAQYAEGQRITSYFSLGRVDDEGQKKDHWLWTTQSTRNQPYQFDSFRVFIWNLRRHRYETAYMERNLTGYFPVELTTVRAKVGRVEMDQPGFSLVTAAEDGTRWKKTYLFQQYRVVMVQKTPWTPPPKPEALPAGVATAAPAAPPEPGWFERLKRWGADLFRAK